MLSFTVHGQELSLTAPVMAAESINYITAQFSFDTPWEGHTIWAHFKQADILHDVSVENGAITADKGLNLGAGRWQVWLHGNSYADGQLSQRITTNMCEFEVAEVGSMEGAEPFGVPLTAAQQIEAIAQQALCAAQAVTAAAEAGDFDGEKGDKGDTGATGPQGPQGPQGPKGDTGTSGKSAYASAQDGGYTGTEAQFNTALAAVSSKQPQHTKKTVTLTAAGWSNGSQTVSVSGVTANNTVIISPAPAFVSAYGNAGIYASAQGAGTITFTCDTAPTAAISVNVAIFD